MQYLSRTNLPTDALIFFAISAGCGNFKCRCCNIMVDSAMFVSLNRFSSNKLSLHTKTYCSEHDKNFNLFVIFSFFHRAIEKHEHYVTYFLSSANFVL